MSTGIYTQDVTEILDMFYANGDAEPDWAAIKTRLFQMHESHYTIIINMLRAFWAIYEDQSAFETLMFRLQEDLPA